MKNIKKLDHPKDINFFLISKCNSNCIMCGASYSTNSVFDELRFREYKSILNNLTMSKIKSITFSGGGEPLLNKNFNKIINFTNKFYQEIGLSLFTNGIALSKKIANKLIKKNFIELLFQ